MIKLLIELLIIWTICSFLFLLNYSGSQKQYENSDKFNLLIYALCYPAFLITVIALVIIEKIEERGNNKNA